MLTKTKSSKLSLGKGISEYNHTGYAFGDSTKFPQLLTEPATPEPEEFGKRKSLKHIKFLYHHHYSRYNKTLKPIKSDRKTPLGRLNTEIEDDIRDSQEKRNLLAIIKSLKQEIKDIKQENRLLKANSYKPEALGNSKTRWKSIEQSMNEFKDTLMQFLSTKA